MIEMASAGQKGKYTQGVAGDSFNTAVYLARAGLAVDYLTRLGDESFSDIILQHLVAEGIGTDLIQRCRGRQPGLYLISNDESGERQFTYWREHSPARDMFDQAPALDAYHAFYFTGITLAVTRCGLDNLKDTLRGLKRQGCSIIFDPNYRPGLWRDREQARQHYREVLPLCDILLPTLEDETALWGIETVDACHAMYRELDVREIVIKGCDLTTHVFAGEQTFKQRAQPVTALDTTGAGDAFNAGYLAQRLQGKSIEAAVTGAQQLSAAVVQHRGAILPRGNTESF
jgi:2-dehydro-3-deoxygluconokinase